MVKRIGTARRKTRSIFSKSIKEKGKLSLTKYLQEFKTGDKVVLKAEPSIQKGLYFPRFHGKQGTIAKKQGECYEVKIKDFTKEKMLIVHPVHLKRL